MQGSNHSSLNSYEIYWSYSNCFNQRKNLELQAFVETDPSFTNKKLFLLQFSHGIFQSFIYEWTQKRFSARLFVKQDVRSWQQGLLGIYFPMNF